MHRRCKRLEWNLPFRFSFVCDKKRQKKRSDDHDIIRLFSTNLEGCIWRSLIWVRRFRSCFCVLLKKGRSQPLLQAIDQRTKEKICTYLMPKLRSLSLPTIWIQMWAKWWNTGRQERERETEIQWHDAKLRAGVMKDKLERKQNLAICLQIAPLIHAFPGEACWQGEK